MKRAIVHIGLPKTGTSAIQHVLSACREQLLREGVLFPKLDRQHNVIYSTMFSAGADRHPINVAEGISSDDIPVLRVAYHDAFRRQLDGAEWNTLLLSSESLSNLAPGEVLAFSQWLFTIVDEVRILVYLRNPVDWARSNIQQFLKLGRTLESMATRPPTQSFRKVLSPFIDVFGLQNLDVCSYEEATGHPSGLINHFATHCGLPTDLADEFARHETRENQSMSAEAASLLSELNNRLQLLPPEQRREERSKARFGRIMNTPGTRFELTPAQVDFIRRVRREDIRWLHETFAVSWYADIPYKSPQRGRAGGNLAKPVE